MGHHPTPTNLRFTKFIDQIYTEARLLQEGATDIEYEVFVLKGGFADFQQLFKVGGVTNHSALLLNAPVLQHDPELVENWDKLAWG